MGESFNSVHRLEPPFLFVDERVIFVPHHRRLEVNNRDIKLLLFFEGSADLMIDGHPVGRLKPADILVVPRRCRQTYIPTAPTETRMHVMRIYFDFSALRLNLLPSDSTDGESGESVPPDPEIDFAAFVRHHFRSVRILTNAPTTRIQEWAKKIRAESEQRETGFRYRIGAYCRLIATEIARILEQQSEGSRAAKERSQGKNKNASWMIEHVKQFMFENCARPLTLDEIAWDVKLSAEHLCRRFKEDTGQTVFAYLRELRVEAAKAYLISSKQSITDIAARTGFSSSTVFCRIFRSMTKQAPLEYRKSSVNRISFQRTTLDPDDRIY